MDTILLGYVGPDTVLPVASAFAAVMGAILLFAKSIWRSIVNFFRRVRGGSDKPTQGSAPEGLPSVSRGLSGEAGGGTPPQAAGEDARVTPASLRK